MAKTMATTSAASTAIISATDLAQMQALDQQIAEFREKLADPAIGGMAKMLIQAKAIATLEQAITPAMMRDVMKLMDSPLGFRTDRPPGATDRNGKPLQQYGEATVKRCLIVAWLSGAQATGNEFNIIASNCYLTKSFTRSAILRFPGVSHLELQIGAPFKHSDRTAVVDAIARWRLNGEQHEICCLKTAEMDARIVVNCYQTSSPDEIRGKVEAKLYQRILSRLTGMNMDGDDESAVVNTIEGRVVSALPSEPADADSQIVEAEPAGNGISDAEAARHICEAWQADLEKLEMINDVKVGLKDRLALVQSAEWPKELVDGTIDYITQLANDRMEAIRATRGEKSNS